MPDVAFVNGRFLPFAAAVVSIDDRGFQFGDGVYEVIRTYGGRPFLLDAHLTRLDRSANALDIEQPYPHRRWREVIDEGLRRAAYAEAKVYIQLTRGTAPREHSYGSGLVPTIVMTVRELHPLSDAVRACGVEAITIDDIRWGRCDIKSLNLLPNVLARQQAKRAGGFETIYIEDGMVTEGAASNVLIVQHGSLKTAPEGPRILSGVTRALVLALAREAGLSVDERSPTREELMTAEEVLLTGTTVEVLAVTKIDGQPIGKGEPGPVTRKLAGMFLKRTA
ncbi:MAG TPA: D-amino-acid transaminase [Nitrospira sp.]|nr:D-amino-acid transaminase [Nitrospira sp.]